MALKITHKYDDIIHLPHPVSSRHSRMSNHDRAAQFSPFAALTGFEEIIAETGRVTDRRIELTEEEKSRLNEVLQEISRQLPFCPRTAVTYFSYDPLKSGGAYLTETVQVKSIHPVTRRMVLTDGREISLEEIIELQIL